MVYIAYGTTFRDIPALYTLRPSRRRFREGCTPTIYVRNISSAAGKRGAFLCRSSIIGVVLGSPLVGNMGEGGGGAMRHVRFCPVSV